MKLGQKTTDTATGRTVTPITLQVQTPDGLNRMVWCQPFGLSHETGAPLDGIWLTEDRLKDGPIEATVPHWLIGEDAEDDATGFKGKVIHIILYINGCLHVSIQPGGVQPKSGSPVVSDSFDIRRVIGPAFKKFSEEELAKSRDENPSPVLHSAYMPPRPKP